MYKHNTAKDLFYLYVIGMDSTLTSAPKSLFSIVITAFLALVGAVVIYAIYNFLYGSSASAPLKILTSQVPANVAQTNLPAISGLYEGGDYAVSVWIYISSYNINRNKRKHILEIGGANFSTILIALGAFKNTLMVRTQSRDSDTAVVGGTTPTAAATTTPSTVANPSANPSNAQTQITGTPPPTPVNYSGNAPTKWNPPVTGIRQYKDASGNTYYVDSSGNITDNEGYILTNSNKVGTPTTTVRSVTRFVDSNTGIILYKDAYGNVTYNPPGEQVNLDERLAKYESQITGPTYNRSYTNNPEASTEMSNLVQGFRNETPCSDDATRNDGSLTAADLNKLFTPLAMDDSLLNPTQICDIPNIDMQRWVNITVVLSGRMIDVYIDGKLSRSCVTASYYKVDPTGVKLKVAERGGFDGYLNGISTFNYPLSPADVYRLYEVGPAGKSAGINSLVSSLFGGK